MSQVLSFKGQFPSQVTRWWCQKVRCRAGTYFGTLCRTLTDSSGLPEQAKKTLTTTRHNTKGPASQGVVFLALTQFGHQGNARSRHSGRFSFWFVSGASC
jgi:hypothetical protein